MQGDELVPSGKNVVTRCAGPRAPHRLGRDCTLNPLKKLGKSTSLEIVPHFLGLFGRIGTVVMVVGEGGDDAGAQLVGLGMGEFEGRLSHSQLDEKNLGPLVIKERVRLIRGELEIESVPGHGARLDVRLPKRIYA